MAAITKALLGEDMSGELKQEVEAHLETLFALGESKCLYYAERINESLLGAGQGTDRTFPISTIQYFIKDTRAYTTDNAENISGVINGSIKDFVADDNVGGATRIISGLVNLLFGAASGSEHEKVSYFAMLEGASMVRFDFAGWSKQVTSQALKQKVDLVTSFVLYRSIVDMSKVSLNDFISVYQDTVKAENPDFTIDKIIMKCKEIFYLFNPQAGLAESQTGMKKAENKTFFPTKGYDSIASLKKDIISL